ncbi:uncharacterized protein BT62DRAFT_936730 [Guyanagaster necrorhizus]|uniref:F-box domain-containing protein n=1 Tax=Guyanagaster necrorhizus TaxID=856835 RepID=A0A9P7VKW9_9AGAR|nr:uncharacterized protein BT62DRAFT_936730 [Guyanagaster necrorhizus MCA 3950]KAG7441851.1 hypothetical protein BT62DRAFT_936730 [Guyanagaster necrorhizus MCA 3950]
MAAPESLRCMGCTCPNHSITSSHRHISTPPIVDTSAKADLAYLKTCNLAPSEEEAKSLRHFISSCQSRVKKLNEEESSLQELIVNLERRISSSERRIAALQKERRQAVAQIREWSVLLDPIRCLPPEIWSRIFSETIEFPTFPQASFRLDSHTGALTHFHWNFTAVESTLWAIEGVCKKWKAVAVNSPELWAFINIVISDSNFGPNTNGYVRRLGRQLGRSGNRPLSIIISCPDYNRDSLPPQLTMMLYSFSDRIQHLRLYIPSGMLNTIPYLGLSLPYLKTLFILSTDMDITPDADNINEPLELFPVCPNLRELQFVDINDNRSFSLPWQQITDYRCWYYRHVGPDASVHISSLERMIHLQDCFLRCSLPSRRPSPNRAPPLCREYRLLDLHSDHDNGGDIALRQIMDTLTLPALQQLKVTCPAGSTRYFNEGTFSSIHRLLNRSIPPLTRLHFCGGSIVMKDLLHVILSTPSLEDLQLNELYKDTITPDIIIALILNLPSGVVNVPRLHTLHLSGVGKAGVSLLVDMIRSRWILDGGLSKDVSRLKSIKIESDYDFLEHYSQMAVEAHDISQWISDGLSCEFRQSV